MNCEKGGTVSVMKSVSASERSVPRFVLTEGQWCNDNYEISMPPGIKNHTFGE